MSNPTVPTNRQDAILGAAFQAFATYGFRRTSMDDIASAAGLSRTALYLHFRNKEDLFRQMTRTFFADVNEKLKTILDGPEADPRTTLAAAFRAKDGKFMEVVLGTPHGAELMDAGFSIAGDIAADGEMAFQGQLAIWINRRRPSPELGTPEQIATTMMAALRGIKSASRSLDDYRASQERLALLFGCALQNRP